MTWYNRLIGPIGVTHAQKPCTRKLRKFLASKIWCKFMHIVQEKTCTKSMTQAQEMCASFWYKILLCVSPLLDTTKHNVTAFSTLVYSVLQISLLAYLKPCLLPEPATATGETKSDIRASPIYKYTNSNKKNNSQFPTVYTMLQKITPCDGSYLLSHLMTAAVTIMVVLSTN